MVSLDTPGSLHLWPAPGAIRLPRQVSSAQGQADEVGVGYATAHHGELLQGMFDDGTGQLRRALVTMPQYALGSRAVFYPSQNHWGFVAEDVQSTDASNLTLTKVRRAAVLALREFVAHPATARGGRIEITSDVPRGIGMGSSTSDVTATIRAIADYHGIALPPEQVSRLAVLAEGASDSIMFTERVVLFAQRDGLVLETLGYRLPPLVVLGCDTRPGHGGVDTLRHPPAEYDDKELGAFQVLRAALRRALATGDVRLLGRVTTASARINQRFLPKPQLEQLHQLCLGHGGCGVQVAHSGTVAGLLFDPARPGVQDDVRRCRDQLAGMGLPVTAVIGVDPDEAGLARPANLRVMA